MVRFTIRKMKRTMAMITMAAMVCSIPVMPTEKTEPIKVMAETDTQEACNLNITVNFKEEIATVTSDDGLESDVLYYAVTTKDKIEKNSYPKDSAYEAVYIGEAKEIKIDLSNIPMKKEQVLCVTDCATIGEKMPATASLPQQKTLVAKYVGALDPDKDSGSYIGNSTIGYITFSEKEDKDKEVLASEVEFRTINGYWKNAADGLSQAMTLATAKGANFQMRIAPTDDTPAGKIINVKMSAKAKAPKVTVNYFTHTLKVSNKMEYSLDNGAEWNAFTGKEAYFKDLGWDGTKDILVYVRTAASGKKSSSKIAYVTIKGSSDYTKITVAEESGDVKAFKAAEFGSGNITVAYKTIYDKSSGVLITNGTDNMYQACIVEESVVAGLDGGKVEDGRDILDPKKVTTALSLDGKKVEGKVAIKWTKVNAQNTKSSKCATATLQTKGLEQDKNYVILYRAVDKKGTEICSNIYVAELPGVFTQTITATLDGSDVPTDIKVVADAPAKITLAVDGKVSEKSKFTAKAWEDEECEKSLASTKVKAVISGNELTVTPGKDCPKEFYVKIQFEGAEKVLKFSIKGEEQTE
ncbi:MAG: hypothetical protein II992_11395 [Lachnospiraceae bacterium]|nr:hypothetical protein [Lachnospiraceae bacterium]